MTATESLTADLKAQVLFLEDDLRERLAADADREAKWRAEHREAISAGRTATAWQAFRDDRITQVAVAWVLTTVFLRFCEDNGLVEPVWIAGPAHRRQEAADAQLEYFRSNPEHTDREWLLQGIEHLGSLPATAELVAERSPLWQIAPSGNAATALLDFWRTRDDEGDLVHDLTDPSLSTRFLGDLYQDLSDHAKKTYALLQTPVFVEEFILDQTLEPALEERPLEGFRLIDPTCGSGHFLLGAFDRLLQRWRGEGIDDAEAARRALESVHGVDINPFAVAIARFRLTVAALHALGLTSLAEAPKFTLNLAVGDSLLHGPQTELDLGDHTDAELGGFGYSTEDLDLLRDILTPGSYDVVVGNPPYITVKDKTLNVEYRRRYSTCKGKYAMTVPFMERFFDLARRGAGDQPAGWAGQITSNSFMKREFGSKLIEEFLVKQDLQLVADTSGAYIPGHGTPTVIITGRHQRPQDATVRTVLGIRGEPGRPEEPTQGLVWRAIADHVNEPGYEDEWVTVTNLERDALATHPWSLSGGGAAELGARIEKSGTPLLEYIHPPIGGSIRAGADEAYMRPLTWKPNDSDMAGKLRPLVMGDIVRDWIATPDMAIYFPYAYGSGSPKAGGLTTELWNWRTTLAARATFQGRMADAGIEWWEYMQFTQAPYRTPLSIAFAEVATHNHFVLDRGGKVFKQTAPVIKLPEGASEDNHLALLGVLNSSTACFWLRENTYDKGSAEGVGSSEPWQRRRQFNGSNVGELPLPPALPLERGRTLDRLAQQASD